MALTSAAVADKHLLFLSKPTGYELREGDGDPPVVGATVEVGEEQPFFVSKVGASPLPFDRRPCAYLMRIR